MRNLNLKTTLLVIVGMSVIVGAVLIWLSDIQTVTFMIALKLVPKVVSIDVMIIGVFASYLWKLGIFRGWLVQVPDLNGTWKGFIHSTWVNPDTGKRTDPIPTALTIKQSFFKISCVMRTGEMTSRSTIADFIIDGDNQVKQLSYTYDSNPLQSVKDRSPQHFGTIRFDIIQGKPMKLKGEYWTGRKTTGEVELTYWKKKLLDEYPKELGEHPVSGK